MQKRRKLKNNAGKHTRKSLRQHFGRGRLAPNPATSVFINCPFDAEYGCLFDAIVFATLSCGFFPRSALESGNVAESRMDRIANAIASSKYSIHDLSRCKGEGSEGLARFNMPLELGIAVGRRIAAGAAQHDWLILVPEKHKYVKYISDLAGFDPKTHNGTVEGVVSRVMVWLATRPDAVYVPTPHEVVNAFRVFKRKRRRLHSDWKGEVPWADLILTAISCVP